MCKAATSGWEDCSVMVVEPDTFDVAILALRFRALEGSHHSGYPIKS